ncbi:uncharacterized protein TNCV_3645461 [Trichonephila clavipes]|nr:uncharacterized protein TNCV_3645461 [Trichonephila clavipes]
MFAVCGVPSEPAPVNRLVVPLFSVPKRHCCRVSAANKGCRVYPLDPRPDAVALYSGCILGKLRAWFLQDDQHTAYLVGLRGGWRRRGTPERSCVPVLMDPMLLCPGIGLVLPNRNIDHISTHTRFLLISLPNNEMASKSPFAIQKALPQQLSQTFAQAAKSITVSNSSQTDENITKIKCPPLKLLEPFLSLPKPNASVSTPAVSTSSTSSSSTPAQLLPSTSSIAATVSEPQPPIPLSNDVLSNNMFTPIESSSIMSTSPTNSGIQLPSTSNTVRDTK